MRQLYSTLKAFFITAAFIVAFSASAQSQIIIEPAPGVVKSLVSFAISFDGEWSLGSNRNARFTVTGPEGVDIPAVRSGSQREYYLVYFEGDAELKTPGKYTLTIPEGKFAIGNKDIPETVFEYEIEASETPLTFPDYAIFPEVGVYQTLSDGFRLMLDTEGEISVKENGVTFSGVEQEFKLDIKVSTEFPAIDVIPLDASNEPATVSKPGDYTLIFASRSISVDGATNPRPLVFVFTVTGTNVGNWTGVYTADPENGSQLTSIKNIKITFEGANVVKVSDSAGPSQFPTLYNDDKGIMVTRGIGFGDKGVLDISLSEEVTSGGNYTLVVPSKFVKIDGYNPPEDLRISYSIVMPGEEIEYTYTLDPEAGSMLGASEVITITFEGDNIVSVENNPYAWGNFAPYFSNTFGAYNPNLKIQQNGSTFAIAHDWPFEENGTYTLIIPEDYFTFTDAQGNKDTNQLITAEYHVGTTGVESIRVDNSKSQIFNLNGMHVSGNLSDLAPGIYLINGKKILVK